MFYWNFAALDDLNVLTRTKKTKTMDLWSYELMGRRQVWGRQIPPAYWPRLTWCHLTGYWLNRDAVIEEAITATTNSQFFYGFYWFLLKNLFWGSKKAQNLGFLKCAGTTDSSFFYGFYWFLLKKLFLGVKQCPNFGVFEMAATTDFTFFIDFIELY